MNKNIKIFALLICMLMTTSVIWADDNASDFYFPEGMTWTISILSDYGCDHKSVFVLQGDTLINGKTYHNVRMYNAKEQQVLSIPITAEGKKIYAHIYDRDILLYDFGLEVGDSIMHYRSINLEDGIPEDYRFDPDSAYIYVSKVDSITLLDGRRAKCLHYKDRRYQDEYYIRTDIEYVGCSHGGLFSIIDVPLQTTCGSNACCCTLNGELIYEDYAGVCALMDIHGTSPADTVALYWRSGDGPGSTTVTPVDPNQVIATLNDNQLTIREQSGEEVTYSLAVTPISHAPARHELPEAQKEVSADTFRNSVAVQLSEDGSYTLTLSKAGWENDIYGTFDYTASGLQPIAATDAPARKLLRNGQLFIQQGDKIFTITGVQTK